MKLFIVFLHGQGFESWQVQEIFCSWKASRLALGPGADPATSSWVLKFFPWGLSGWGVKFIADCCLMLRWIMGGAIAVLALRRITLRMEETLLFSFHFNLYKILILTYLHELDWLLDFSPCGIVRLFNIWQMLELKFKVVKVNKGLQ